MVVSPPPPSLRCGHARGPLTAAAAAAAARCRGCGRSRQPAGRRRGDAVEARGDEVRGAAARFTKSDAKPAPSSITACCAAIFAHAASVSHEALERGAGRLLPGDQRLEVAEAAEVIAP